MNPGPYPWRTWTPPQPTRRARALRTLPALILVGTALAAAVVWQGRGGSRTAVGPEKVTPVDRGQPSPTAGKLIQSAEGGENGFLAAPVVSTMPAGWTGPTWFQVHGASALQPIEAGVSTAAVPGGPYLASGLQAGNRGTAMYVPVVPVAVGPAAAFEAMTKAVGMYGTVTQHAYNPVILPVTDGVEDYSDPVKPPASGWARAQNFSACPVGSTAMTFTPCWPGWTRPP